MKANNIKSKSELLVEKYESFIENYHLCMSMIVSYILFFSDDKKGLNMMSDYRYSESRSDMFFNDIFYFFFFFFLFFFFFIFFYLFFFFFFFFFFYFFF